MLLVGRLRRWACRFDQLEVGCDHGRTCTIIPIEPPPPSPRLHIRRGHAFEDSFYQLRMRSPAEMKHKLSVLFQGEEGVDAGGVTREWYQVRSVDRVHDSGDGGHGSLGGIHHVLRSPGRRAACAVICIDSAHAP